MMLDVGVIGSYIDLYVRAGDGESADGPGGIAGDKMVRKWYLGEEELCNFFICNPVRHVFGVCFHVN